MPYKKIPFYFRSKEQMNTVFAFAEHVEVNAAPKYKLPARGVFDPGYVIIESAAWNRQAVHNRIPAKTPGRKKYIGTINVDESVLKAYPALFDDFFATADVERVPKTDSTPKYSDDEITRTTIRLKNVSHFRKVTSALNKEYGHGNWHLRGARRIMRKLRQAENWAQQGDSIFSRHPATPAIKEIARKGLKVDVVVKDKVTNLKPLLFKIQLMI